MSTATAQVTYRKTKTGEWVAYGPTTVVTAGATVTVTKRSGEAKTERVARVGRPFNVGGVEMVYGYLAASPATPSRPTRSSSANSRCSSCRCHRERNAGQPGSILYDGCDRCGCEAF